LYCTGDLARWLPDGNVELLGRIDHQVKLRGFRLELKGIETALAEHPGVHEAVVMLHGDRPGDQRLVAYFVPNSDPAATAGELRRFLRDRLPDYAVPSAFVPLPVLPRSPNGKLDRKALPAPNGIRPDLVEGFVGPGTATEETLAHIWCDVLGLKEAGVDDNFFDLGGHSLKITQVISRVRQAFQVEVPFEGVFQAPTIASLAALVEELLVDETAHCAT